MHSRALCIMSMTDVYVQMCDEEVSRDKNRYLNRVVQSINCSPPTCLHKQQQHNILQAVLPDVPLHTALASELVLHQVRVVGGGDEVMAQRLAHVLEDAPPLWVEDGALSRTKVHQEPIKCHGIQQLGWKCSRVCSVPTHIVPKSNPCTKQEMVLNNHLHFSMESR